MIGAESKVDAAARATGKVEHLASQAAQLLREGSDGKIMINSLGAYQDPSKRRGELQSAVEMLARAIAQMDAIAWPTDRDYDAL